MYLAVIIGLTIVGAQCKVLMHMRGVCTIQSRFLSCRARLPRTSCTKAAKAILELRCESPSLGYVSLPPPPPPHSTPVCQSDHVLGVCTKCPHLEKKNCNDHFKLLLLVSGFEVVWLFAIITAVWVLTMGTCMGSGVITDWHGEESVGASPSVVY